MLALPATMAKAVDQRIGIPQKIVAKIRITPGAGNQPGPDMRADVMFILIDDGLKCGRINQPLFDKDRFQRLDAQCRLGRQKRMRVTGICFIMVIMWHGYIMALSAMTVQTPAASRYS